MKRLTAATGAGVTVLALSLALVGCGSDSKTDDSAGSATSSVAESPTSSADAAKTNKTISDYVAENKITEMTMKRGDAGPTIDVPLPADWQPMQGEPPKGTYGAIIYTKSALPNNPPRILALLSKLTGDVDPAEILKYAPGELNNLPGFVGNAGGDPSKVGGFDAVHIGGTYADGAKKGAITQKTVVIPSNGAIFVLQLNGFSDESEAPALDAAMTFISDKTTIKVTP